MNVNYENSPGRQPLPPEGEVLKFSLRPGIGNGTIDKALDVFRRGGMLPNARAIQALASLFSPVLGGATDVTGFASISEKEPPKSLWDEIKTTYSRPKDFPELAAQREILPYYLLATLSNDTNIKYRGVTRSISPKIRTKASDMISRYEQQLAQRLDPDNPAFHIVDSMLGLIGKTAPGVAMTWVILDLNSCSSRPFFSHPPVESPAVVDLATPPPKTLPPPKIEVTHNPPTKVPAEIQVPTATVPVPEQIASVDIPNYSDPIGLIESSSEGQLFTYRNIEAAVASGASPFTGLSVGDLSVFMQNVKTTHELIRKLNGTSIPLSNFFVSWNTEPGNVSRNTTLAISNGKLYWLIDTASETFSLDPSSAVFNFEVDPVNLSYRDIPLPSGVAPEQVVVNWRRGVPIVTIGAGDSGIQFLFNPGEKRWINVEVLGASPANVETWSQRMQDYYRGENGSGVTNEQFDLFWNEMVKNTLTQWGEGKGAEAIKNLLAFFNVPSVGAMSQEQLVWGVLTWEADNKQEITLPPSWLVATESVRANAIIPYYYSSISGQSGEWYQYGIGKSFLQRYVHDVNVYEQTVDGLFGTPPGVTTKAYGQEVPLHRRFYDQITGDLVGVFRLPGVSDSNVMGILVRQRAQDGTEHLWPMWVSLAKTDLEVGTQIMALDDNEKIWTYVYTELDHNYSVDPTHYFYDVQGIDSDVSKWQLTIEDLLGMIGKPIQLSDIHDPSKTFVDASGRRFQPLLIYYPGTGVEWASGILEAFTLDASGNPTRVAYPFPWEVQVQVKQPSGISRLLQRLVQFFH